LVRILPSTISCSLYIQCVPSIPMLNTRLKAEYMIFNSKMHIIITYTFNNIYFVTIKCEIRELQIWRWPSRSWSYGTWICNMLCNQCPSPLKFWVRISFMERCTRYNNMWWRLSMTCSRSEVFSGYSGFLHHNHKPNH
jgi:hypothetical protein